jgi:hypothetical protein
MTAAPRAGITWHLSPNVAATAVHNRHAADVWANCDEAGSYSWCIYPVGVPGTYRNIQADSFEAAKAAAERALRAASDGLPYVVTDSTLNEQDGPLEDGQREKVLGRFATEDAAAEFIGTLPGHLDGRYNLDGPPDDW